MTPLPTGTLTFLFTDIEGSTARWEHFRDAMAVALARHDAILRAAIEGRGGIVVKTVGDGFCATFGDAEAALMAALDAQRALAAEDWSAFGPDFSQLRVRMGIHSGLAQARDGDYYGPALNRTARLMSAGHGGQVLISLAVQQVLRDYLPADTQLRDLGEHRLKDLRYSEHIFQVVAEDLADVVTPPVTAESLTARDRVQVVEGASTRPLPEALAVLLAAVRSDDDAGTTVALSPEQAREIAQRRPADLTEYRLGRIAEWSQPRYRLDGRFVGLTLLIDQGEEATQGRWAAKEERYEDLGALLAETSDLAVVVLGPPGGGKSTLLRRLELDTAIAGLRGESGPGGEAAERITFFVPLSTYAPDEPGQPPPSPGRWLSSTWRTRYPDLPALDDLLAAGRVTLLLDALNEMPAPSEKAFRTHLQLWKAWLQQLAATPPGNRVVISCRSLDYSQPLSTPDLRVPQVRIEPLSDTQVRDFLLLYSPGQGREIWAALEGRPQLEVLRSPYFLALLVEQVEGSGEIPEGRAGLFTGFVRQALRREVERGSALFEAGELLESRDLRKLAKWQWQGPYDLPDRGPLIPKLARLAHAMQEATADGGGSQVRVNYDEALDLVDSEMDEAIMKAGAALAVLDEDEAAGELMYIHQLVQEYFAARELAREPKPDLLAAPWRAAEISPTVPELLASLSPADTLPPLPQTGWEETALLAAVMTEHKEAFARGLLAHNLVVAGRAAAQAELRGQLSLGLFDELRWALVARSRDGDADLRARIAAGYVLGELGDPRFERSAGPAGAYLLPPMVRIPAGEYPIGDDAPITIDNRGRQVTNAAHRPRHAATVAAFRTACFPVTNAEYGCFMAAGGYADERWWQTEDARRWQRGEIANEGAVANNRYWRRRYLAEEGLFQQMEDEGIFPSAEALERWKRWLTLDEATFEAELAERWMGAPQTEPEFWRDERFSHPSQPVVGVCWYEARAYAAWLSAQAGETYRLPTEVEWEAAARGAQGRAWAWGDGYAPERGNTIEARLRRASPVGVFVEGDTPEGLSDLSGNVIEWTSSLFGDVEDADDAAPDFAYPYRADDGREDVTAPSSTARVLRGGSWGDDHQLALAAVRDRAQPDNRHNALGFRLVLSSPVSPEPLASGAA